MQFSFNRIAPLIAAAALMILSSGCDGDAPSGPGTTVVKPGVGSFYAYKTIRYDDAGSPTSTRFDTISVRGTNETLGTMTGLISMWASTTKSLVYMQYAANGDLKIYDPKKFIDNDSLTVVNATASYPFGSHTNTQTDADTTSSSSSNGYVVSLDSMVYAGSQSLTVPGGTFTVTKVSQVIDTRSYNPAGQMTWRVREMQHLYFAPSIGFIVKFEGEHIFYDAAGTVISSRTPEVMELTSHKLQ